MPACAISCVKSKIACLRQETDHENSNRYETVSGVVINAPKKNLLQRYYKDTANRDVGTQTEPCLIEDLKLIISQREETIQELIEQIGAYEGKVHEECNEENSQEMTIDDDDSDMDEKSVTDHTHDTRNVQSNYNLRIRDRNLKTRPDDMVPIGNGNAKIPRKIFQSINWNKYRSATRKLLSTVFSRRVLATHCLTVKQSPGFPNKTAKKQLNPRLVNDIVKTVSKHCGVAENLVRKCITIKCADECKLLRTRENKCKNRENLPPESAESESDSDGL